MSHVGQDAFDAGQRLVLERIATGAALPDVLAGIVRLIEAQSDGMLCSILLLEPEGRRIASGVAPSLPPSFMQALEGAAIGPQAGSCGTAAYRRERVIVEDIATHPYWEAYKGLALPHGLRACWSSPIFGPTGEVFGTFAMYYRESRGPTAAETAWVDAATHLCAVAILRDRTEAERRRLVSALGTRVRELTLLHRTAHLLQADRPFDAALLSDIVQLIPQAWQHPDLCEARITCGGFEAATRGWRESAWMQSARFRCGNREGEIQVAYRQAPAADGPTFSPEEDQLICSVGDMLSAALRREESRLALQRSEERLRAVIEHTPNVTIQWYDRDGHLLFWNRASERLYGWSRDSALGRRLDELNFSAEETERFLAAVRQVSETGEPCGPTEFRFRRADGTDGVLLSTVFQIPSPDGPPCFVCMDVDLTEYRRMEDTVRASERLRALTFASVEDVIFYLAVEGPGHYRFLAVNPAFLAATGLTETQVVGHTLDEVIPEPSRSVVIDKYQQAIDARRAVSWEEVTVYPAGVKYGEVTVAPLYDEAGQCTNLVGTVHDVTARKQAEEERRQLEAQLHQSQRMQSLGTLTGGIAHDFNNILLAIGGHADLALSELPARHPIRDNLEEIQRAHRRATGMVRQILTFSRRETPERAPIDVAPVVQEALALLRVSLPPSVQLNVRLSADVPQVLADSTQVHQTIVNLGTNACHALGTRGGTIEVSSDFIVVGPGSSREVPELADGGYVRVSVADDGCGMDAATQARIFEPFFTTKPVGVGTGLGLSVVHGIMKSHDGAVAVASRLGHGTTVSLYFPAAVGTSAEPIAPIQPVVPRLNHILYVDDEDALVYLVERILRRLGYAVTGHSDPVKALQDFRARPDAFDAVVTDITMPNLPGPDLAREVLAIRPEIPVVLMSGYVRPEDARAAQDLGIGDILVKPGSSEAFGHALIAAIASSHAARGAAPAS